MSAGAGGRRLATRRWDLVVVGGGPAGMSAALIASQNHLTTLLLEASERLGGQVRWADAPIPDLLGAEAATGDELADRFETHLGRSRARVQTAASVERIRCQEEILGVTLESGEDVMASRVLLASGLRHRKLGVPGIELADRVGAPRKELDRFRGCRVAIVGGGDEASSLAQDLAENGASVTLLVRSVLRARPRYAEAIRVHDAVEIRQPAVVASLEIEGSEEVDSEVVGGGVAAGGVAGSQGRPVLVTLTNGEVIPVDECFVRIGVEPSVPKIDPPLLRLPDGRLQVDEHLRTSNVGLFAAGDLVRPPDERYIATALADGAVVGRRVETDLARRSSKAT